MNQKLPGLLLGVACALGAADPDRSSQTPAQPPAGGQVAVTVGQPAQLTLEDALALAEKYNPMLQAADAQRAGAQAAIQTARAYPNPDANILTGQQFSRWNHGSPGAPGNLQHYSVGQLWEWGSVRRTRVAVAERGRESSEFSMTEAQISVRANVKQAFYEVLRRRGEIELAEENLRLIQELRRRIEVQVGVGEAARLELTRADAEVATARTLSRSAQLRVVTGISVLRAAINAPLDASINPYGALDVPKTLPTIEEMRKAVVERHPALAQARAEIRRAEARLTYEGALRTPQPTMRAEYENQPDLRFFRVGISLPVPLWNKREGPIAEAVAAVTQAKAITEVRRLELTAALERAVGQYELASQQVTSYQDGVLRQAEAAVRAAEAAYRFGERGILEVLDAQRVLRSVRSDFLNAQFDRQSALIELERLRAVD